MKSKVSVVIPAYNCEEKIERCIKSVISQTYTNIEVIIINDGSTDGTLKVIKKLALDSMIIIDKENNGVSSARNDGIKNSTGKYILFIDADDWIESNTVEKLVNVIEEKKVDVVRYSCFKNQNRENLYNLKDKYIEKNEIENIVLSHFLTGNEKIMNLVMLLFIKRDFLIENNIFFNVKLYMMEDVEFYQKIFNSCNGIYFLSACLYHYEYNSNSVTNNPKNIVRNIFGIIDTNKEIRRYLKLNKINNDLILSMNANHLRIIINFLIEYLKYNGVIETYKMIKRLKSDSNFNFLLNNKLLRENMNTTNYIMVFGIKNEWLLKFILILLKIKI